MILELTALHTMAAGILALLTGSLLNRWISALRRFCIPSPVTGGIIFSLVSLALYKFFGIEIRFDGSLKDVCMIMFFTSVGLQSDLKVLKNGGRPMVVMVILVTVLIIFQNLIGIWLAVGLGQSPLLGMSAGSITMSGGHGTAAGFSQLLESLGLPSASTILMATATFGLLGGSLIGGPLAEMIIRKKGLAQSESNSSKHIYECSNKDSLKTSRYAAAVYIIFLSAGLGTLLSKLLSLTGLSFPVYFGSLIVAVIVRNCSEGISFLPKVPMSEITSIGTVSLSLFLGMAMVSLKLWELSGIALPLLGILMAQVLFMAAYARFVAFPLLGKDYEAAVLISGICGFGLGATPNAMANMSAVCDKYRYIPGPFIIIPIVGAMFVDIINTAITAIILNLI